VDAAISGVAVSKASSPHSGMFRLAGPRSGSRRSIPGYGRTAKCQPRARRATVKKFGKRNGEKAIGLDAAICSVRSFRPCLRLLVFRNALSTRDGRSCRQGDRCGAPSHFSLSASFQGSSPNDCFVEVFRRCAIALAHDLKRGSRAASDPKSLGRGYRSEASYSRPLTYREKFGSASINCGSKRESPMAKNSPSDVKLNDSSRKSKSNTKRRRWIIYELFDALSTNSGEAGE
jgi:hypothetical protein